MSEYQYVEHEFAPVYNEESQVLVLGSLPSVKSREQGFYYGHPRNRFWKVVADCQEPAPVILHYIPEQIHALHTDILTFLFPFK